MNRKAALGIACTLLAALLLTGTLALTHAQVLSSMALLDINHASTFWGMPMDSNWGTSAWHIRAAIAHLVDKDLLLSGLSAIVIDNPVPKVPPLFPAWCLRWTPAFLGSVDPLHPGAMSLYNNVRLQPDIYEARDHLIKAAGIGNDTLPWHDNDDDGRIDNPPTSQIDFYTLTPETAPTTYMIANTIEQWIEYVFNDANVVNLVPVEFPDLLLIVWDTTVPDDWHLAFGLAWAVSTDPAPKFLYDLYHTNGEYNYIFYSNADYDAIFPINNPRDARGAQYIFGKTIGTIPISCSG